MSSTPPSPLYPLWRLGNGKCKEQLELEKAKAKVAGSEARAPEEAIAGPFIPWACSSGQCRALLPRGSSLFFEVRGK